MRIAGVEIADSTAAQLANRLRDKGERALARHLEDAISRLDDQVLATARDREAVLRALMDCPAELADLRAALLADQIASHNVSQAF